MTLEARKSEKSCGGWNETPDNSTVRCSLLADLVKSLYEQIDILKSEVYSLREELREKTNLLKIIVTSKIPEIVSGFIQEKKQQKSLITTKDIILIKQIQNFERKSQFIDINIW